MFSGILDIHTAAKEVPAGFMDNLAIYLGYFEFYLQKHKV